MTKLTLERKTAVLDALKTGGTNRCAAALAEVSETTLARWQKRDARFATAVLEARRAAEIRAVEIVRDALAHPSMPLLPLLHMTDR